MIQIQQSFILSVNSLFVYQSANFSPSLSTDHKKPRPKSLAISTPTRLLSLEEARQRALVTQLAPAGGKFINVGGGPNSLTGKYHTVIDLPGYKSVLSGIYRCRFSRILKVLSIYTYFYKIFLMNNDTW